MEKFHVITLHRGVCGISSMSVIVATGKDDTLLTSSIVQGLVYATDHEFLYAIMKHVDVSQLLTRMWYFKSMHKRRLAVRAKNGTSANPPFTQHQSDCAAYLLQYSLPKDSQQGIACASHSSPKLVWSASINANSKNLPRCAMSN